METLKPHEAFEIEVLDELRRGRLLDRLVFGGGTMLRLCHELPRYSVDLDFWFAKKTNIQGFFRKSLDFLSARYQMTDSKNKHFSLFYELKGKTSPRKLKIEIRKEIVRKGVERRIAYSFSTDQQVLVSVFSLDEMAKRKLLAIRNRNEIRDYFDLEFLLRRGASVSLTEKDKTHMERQIKRFVKIDFSVSLGALLEKELRQYYIQNGFAQLLERIQKKYLRRWSR